MGFGPGQCHSHLESVNEFKDQMKEELDEAKAALTKSKDDMARYYDQRHTPAPDYQPRDKVYLEASDIQTTQPSKKLSHRHLSPFELVKRVGNGAYHLKVPQSMSRLHPVFNVIKLTPAPSDPIPGHHPKPPPPLEIVDGEEEWVVEEVLDSKVINWKLWYLIKWKGFGIEHNSWEPWDSIHAPNLIAEFYQKHPGAAHQVRAIDFSAISFRVVPSCHSLKGGVDVRGHPFSPPSHSDPPLSTPFISIMPTYVIPQQH
jgi:Chromo (CHRromatin Organisation MOdifier) domain